MQLLLLGQNIKNNFLGTKGDFGCFSFHESKNIHCGVGGALLVNNEAYLKKTKLIWNRGTNREDFENKSVNKYQWMISGKSSHLSEMQAAFLLSQLRILKKNTIIKKKIFFKYFKKLSSFKNHFTVPSFNKFNQTNYHSFFIVVKKKITRQKFIQFMKRNNIQTVIHYEPLHFSKVGKLLYKKNDLKKDL